MFLASSNLQKEHLTLAQNSGSRCLAMTDSVKALIQLMNDASDMFI